jgi:outer membrane protein TolC
MINSVLRKCILLCFTKRKGSFVAVLMVLTALVQIPYSLFAQQATTDAVQTYNLQQCIDYALKNQPSVRQAMLGASITKATNYINLSGWLPQVNGTLGFAYYPQPPVSLIENPLTPNGQLVAERSAIVTNFIPGINATQAIFTPTLLYAALSAHLYNRAAEQVIDSAKINITVAVCKSFYNLLLNMQEIDVLKADTVMLARSVTDAYHQYVGGIVDITDYQEATITFNNTVAQLKQVQNNVAPYYAALKQTMGYPTQSNFNIVYDTAQMAKDIILDTVQQLQFDKRIEYQQLETARALQHRLTNYYEFSFLPNLGAYANYNYEYENNKLDGLLQTAYPNSIVGLSLSLPLFTGFSRIAGVHRAKLQEKLFDWSEQNLKSVIYFQYTQSLANYNSNLFNLHTQQDNSAMARKVFNIVEMQYKQGIVPYLNVITAQSNLITSEIGYINALFQVLSSKVDVEQAMGIIAY